MKNILQQLTLLTAAIVLLSSCGNLSKMSLTKRHYRSGYFVDFGGIKHIAHAHTTTIEQKKLGLPVTIAKSPEQIILHTSAIKVEYPGNAVEYPVSKKKKSALQGPISTNSATPIALSVTAGPIANPGEQSVMDHHTQVNANVAFAVIVICAIFIPPLGVALMYGINSYFWIDLILTLIFFFPGMIFALIVVLT
jgi:uncharacterized membrane protein YqaE (UPF0057 family)